MSLSVGVSLLNLDNCGYCRIDLAARWNFKPLVKTATTEKVKENFP